MSSWSRATAPQPTSPPLQSPVTSPSSRAASPGPGLLPRRGSGQTVPMPASSTTPPGVESPDAKRRASTPVHGRTPSVTSPTLNGVDADQLELLMGVCAYDETKRAADETKRVWQTPVDTDHLGSDVARLARELMFAVRNGRYLFVGDPTKSGGQNVFNFIVTLADVIDPLMPTQMEELQHDLASINTAKDDTDLVERIRCLIGVGPLASDGHIVNILRCLTLDMLAPSVNLLRSTFFTKYPYGGVNGGNKTTIEIDLNNNIYIIHSRREKSRSDSPEDRFYFTWNCTFTYNLQYKTIDSEINVVAIEFDEGARMAIRRNIRELLEPFVGERNAYSVLWSRQLVRLPVHKDIARLSKSLSILGADGTELFREKEDEEVPGHISFKNIINVLAQNLTDEKLINAVQNKTLWDQYIKTSGDLSEQILAFFSSGVFDEKSPVVKVLKLVNQEMIYPAVMRLRNHLYTQFPYKDVKGGWQVQIHLRPGAITVNHIKREQSHDTREEARFEFEWQLQMVFDHRMESFTPQLYITDYTFSDKTLAEIKRVVLDQMLPFMHPDSMYRRIWIKPIEQTPANRDLIRFFRGGAFEIVNDKGVDLYRQSNSRIANDTESLRQVLVCLAKHLDGPELAQAIESKFPEFFVGGADVADELMKFFQSGTIPATSKTVGVLKCLHSDMVFPGYLKLRNAFYEIFPFRDVKNTWHVQVKINESLKSASVALSKRERTHSELPQDYFEFCWVLVLTFNSEMSSFTSDLRIIDYAWNESTRDDIKASLRPLWAPFIIPQAPSYNTQRLNGSEAFERTLLAPDDILRIVRKALDRQPGILHAEHEDLPASTDVRLLMEQLTEALRTVPNLPLVSIPISRPPATTQATS